MILKTIESQKLDVKSLGEKFKYQKELTKKLDAEKRDFDQAIINEIVLWKVNRYAGLKNETLQLINEIRVDALTRDDELTRKVLELLLAEGGIRLPMASTILRFRNPKIYQIIDQRVYRFICGEALPTLFSIPKQITLYFEYLEKLKEVCENHKIPFGEADRILYQADKELNGDIALSGYGSKG
jgi:thermostable 8-oxoguanine DNA glycosylase